MFGSLSVRENVLAAAEIRRRWSHDRSDAAANADGVLALVGLSHLANRAADTLPTGQSRLLELARALATRPRLLLLDEPSSGLDDTESEELGDLLCQLADAGMAILLVEHDMGLVMRVCSQINVLDFGAVLMVGAPDEVRSDERVRAAYLGRRTTPRKRRTARRPQRACRSWRRRGRMADATPTPSAKPLPPVLELRRVHAAYGQIEVLHGIDLAVDDGLGPRPARAQRGGEVDDAARGQRPDGADEGLLPRARAPRQRLCARRPGPGRAVHAARGPRHLPQPDGDARTCAS